MTTRDHGVVTWNKWRRVRISAEVEIFVKRSACRAAACRHMRNAAIWLDPAHSCRADCSRPAARSTTRHHACRLRRCRRLRLCESAAPCCSRWCTTSASDGCCCCCCFICRANWCCCCDRYCCCSCSCCDSSCCCSDTCCCCCCCCCSTLRKSHQGLARSLRVNVNTRERQCQVVAVCCHSKRNMWHKNADLRGSTTFTTVRRASRFPRSSLRTCDVCRPRMSAARLVWTAAAAGSEHGCTPCKHQLPPHERPCESA